MLHRSPSVIFTNIFCNVKCVDTAEFASDGASFDNQFEVRNIDWHYLNVEAAENLFKYESFVHSVM